LVFQALVGSGGEMDTNEVIEKTKMSRPTALHYMEELGHLGVVSLKESKYKDPVSITLNSQFNWLIEPSVTESEVVSETA